MVDFPYYRWSESVKFHLPTSEFHTFFFYPSFNQVPTISPYFLTRRILTEQFNLRVLSKVPVKFSLKTEGKISCFRRFRCDFFIGLPTYHKNENFEAIRAKIAINVEWIARISLKSNGGQLDQQTSAKN
jgi:hypothetical protein